MNVKIELIKFNLQNFINHNNNFYFILLLFNLKPEKLIIIDTYNKIIYLKIKIYIWENAYIIII